MARILIAEDDPHILRVISLWMSRQGHETVEARNGLAAYESYVMQPPDILVTDVNMPGMDGVELVEKVTGASPAPRGVVVLTNRWDHGEIRKRLSGGGVQVLPKPFSPSKLADVVEQMLAGETCS